MINYILNILLEINSTIRSLNFRVPNYFNIFCNHCTVYITLFVTSPETIWIRTSVCFFTSNVIGLYEYSLGRRRVNFFNDSLLLWFLSIFGQLFGILMDVVKFYVCRELERITFKYRLFILFVFKRNGFQCKRFVLLFQYVSNVDLQTLKIHC